MAVAIAQSSFNAVANATNPQTITLNTTTGRYVVIAANYNGGGAADPSISDSLSNTWVSIFDATGPNATHRIQAWYVNSGTSGSSHAFNLNPAGFSDQGVHWGVCELSDVATSYVDAASTSNVGACSGPDANVTSGTPANQNALLIAAAATRGDFGTVNLNTPSGWANLYLPSVTGGIGSSICYKSVATSGAAQAISWTHDGTDGSIDWVAGMIVVLENTLPAPQFFQYDTQHQYHARR